MAQYNKQNLLLNQRKTKLNTKEIGDLYEIKIMKNFIQTVFAFFGGMFWLPVPFNTKWTQSKPGEGELLFFSFFLIFLLRTFTNILFCFFLENSSLDLSRQNGCKVSQGEG